MCCFKQCCVVGVPPGSSEHHESWRSLLIYLLAISAGLVKGSDVHTIAIVTTVKDISEMAAGMVDSGSATWLELLQFLVIVLELSDSDSVAVLCATRHFVHH